MRAQVPLCTCRSQRTTFGELVLSFHLVLRKGLSCFRHYTHSRLAGPWATGRLFLLSHHRSAGIINSSATSFCSLCSKDQNSSHKTCRTSIFTLQTISLAQISVFNRLFSIVVLGITENWDTDLERKHFKAFSRKQKTTFL